MSIQCQTLLFHQLATKAIRNNLDSVTESHKTYISKPRLSSTISRNSHVNDARHDLDRLENHTHRNLLLQDAAEN
jgi:hypothetical protein